MSYKLGYIAEYLEADLVSASGVSEAAKIEIFGIATPTGARAGQISFIASRAYVAELENTRASAVILNDEFASFCTLSHLVVEDPYLAYAKLSQLFTEPGPEPGIAPSAAIADSAQVDPDCCVGANVVIGDDVVIGGASVIDANVSIGDGVKIGSNSHLYPNVSIYRDVSIGSDCIIHSGAVIGSDGFGFASGPDGYVKICQLGTVIVGDRVEIGANASIDRGALGNTEIHDGVKIDNLVHIAHNCIIGSDTALAGQVGMGGTTEIGRGCTFGGQVGIAGHLKIADGVRVTGKSMVTKKISEPGLYSSGTGFSDNRSWRKNAVRFNTLDDLYRRVLRLEKHENQD